MRLKHKTCKDADAVSGGARGFLTHPHSPGFTPWHRPHSQPQPLFNEAALVRLIHTEVLKEAEHSLTSRPCVAGSPSPQWITCRPL